LHNASSMCVMRFGESALPRSYDILFKLVKLQIREPARNWQIYRDRRKEHSFSSKHSCREWIDTIAEGLVNCPRQTFARNPMEWYICGYFQTIVCLETRSYLFLQDVKEISTFSHNSFVFYIFFTLNLFYICLIYFSVFIKFFSDYSFKSNCSLKSWFVFVTSLAFPKFIFNRFYISFTCFQIWISNQASH